jgi:Flp pilus assembly protein TadG
MNTAMRDMERRKVAAGIRAGGRAAGLTRVASERGASLVEFALMLPLLGLLLLGVIDFGRAYYLSIEINNAAYAGAMYGASNSADTTGMTNAALADAPDVQGMTATPTIGCECSDGSGVTPNCSSPPSCSVNVVNYVQVKTSTTYNTLIPWPGIPRQLTLTGSAVLRASE